MKRLLFLLGLLLTTLTLAGCDPVDGQLTKLVFNPAQANDPALVLTPVTTNPVPTYKVPAGRDGTLRLEFPGPYGNGTGFNQTCNVYWQNVGTSDRSVKTVNNIATLDYKLPGPLAIGSNLVIVSCPVVTGAQSGKDYVIQFVVTAGYDYVYWTTSTGIGRARTDGTESKPNFLPIRKGAKSVTVYNDKIYFSSNGKIGRADLDGTNLDLNWADPPGDATPTSLTVIDNILDWLVNGRFGYRPITGGKISEGSSDVSYLAIASDGALEFLILSGDGPTLLGGAGVRVSLGKGPIGALTLANSTPYWTTQKSIQTIKGAKDIRTLREANNTLRGITFDGQNLFTIDETGTIAATSLDGKAGPSFTVPPSTTGGIAAGPGRDAAPKLVLQDRNGATVSGLNWTMKGSDIVHVLNTGPGDLVVSSVKILDPKGPFLLLPNTCVGTPVVADKRCTVFVDFSPTVAGEYTATLRLTGNMNRDGFIDVPLRGVVKPEIRVSMKDLAFTGTPVGETSAPQSVDVENYPGDVVMSIESIRVTGAQAKDFVISDNKCDNVTLESRDACRVTLVYRPSAVGKSSATLQIVSNATVSPYDLTLTGTGLAPNPPAFQVSPQSFAFGEMATGFATDMKTFTVKNAGTKAITIGLDALSLEGDNANQFELDRDTCDNVTLSVGQECTFGVMFSPTTLGPKQAEVKILSDAPGNPHQVPLSGTGVSPALSYEVEPANIVAPPNGSGQAVVTVTNDSGSPVDISTLEYLGFHDGKFGLTDDNCTGQAIPAGQSCTVKATFSPALGDSGQYNPDLAVNHNGAGNPLYIPITGTVMDS